MEKIRIYADLYGKLEALCETMGLSADAVAPGKLAEHLREVNRLSSIASDEADVLAYHANEALDELRYKDFIDGIRVLSEMVEQLDELQESVDIARRELGHTLCALRELTESAGWSPICSNEEMVRGIETGFSLTDSVSLSYKDGQYALLFEEIDDIAAEPFVFAVGGEEHYDEVCTFLKQFLNMEEEESV